MKATLKFIVIGLLLAVVLAACQPAAPTSTAQPAVSTVTPGKLSATGTAQGAVPPAPTQKPLSPVACAEAFTRHELTAPYRQDPENPQPVYTYSSEEFKTVLADLGIASMCVPQEADAPYLVGSWDRTTRGVTTGRMALISFNGWREAQLVYATYDFQAGLEYDSYATIQDWDAMKASSQKRFERIYVSPMCFGRCSVFKTIVYPFSDHYVALVLSLGAYEPGTALDEQVAKFTAGEYPSELRPQSIRLNGVGDSLQFQD